MSENVVLEGRLKVPAELVLAFITLIWGFTFLVIKIGLAHGGALALVGFRFAMGAALPALITRPSWPTAREWRAGFLIGAALFAGYGLQAQGLTSIASSRSAFFTALYVPMVPLLQFVLFRKRPGWTALAGILLAFGGLVLLSHPKRLTPHLSWGDLLTIACAIACAIEILLLGRYAPRCDPRRLAVVQMGMVAVFSLSASLITGAEPPWAYSPFGSPPGHWGLRPA